MNADSRLSESNAGAGDAPTETYRLVQRVGMVCLIGGPAILAMAAGVSLLDVDRGSGRWYDNWVEGTLMAYGLALLAGGMVAASAIVARRDPNFAIAIALVGLVGMTLAIHPATMRIGGAILVDEGVSLELLDSIFGDGDEPHQNFGLGPGLLFFFGGLLALAVGLWRSSVPRWQPALIAIGAVAFAIAQSSFEVNEPLYIFSSLCWVLGFAPISRHL